MLSASQTSLFSIPLADPPPSGGKRLAGGGFGLRGLDQFIGDEANLPARNLADRLAMVGVEWPAWFSPLVLYGPSGSGKTALARTFVHRWPRHQLRDRQSLHWTGGDFLRWVAGAIDQQTTRQLVARMEQAALVWIDDLQVLERSEAAQQFLLFALDRLEEAGVPFLTTLPAHPAMLGSLRPALTSRLCAGLTVPVALPGVEARFRILGLLSERIGVVMDPAVLRLLAIRFPVPVILLQRIIANLAARSLAGQPVLVSDLAAIASLVDSASDHPGFATRLTGLVAEQFAVPASEILGTSRQLNTVLARSSLVHLLRHSMGWSFSRIGSWLQGKDHSTLLHACRKISQRMTDDPAFATVIRTLEAAAGELVANCLPEPGQPEHQPDAGQTRKRKRGQGKAVDGLSVPVATGDPC